MSGFSGAHLGAVARGGISVGSVYLKDGLGMRGENLTTLDLIEGWIRKTQGLWLIGGDWNMDPERLAP